MNEDKQKKSREDIKGEIKDYLRHGDKRDIAEAVGCTTEFVYLILSGKRNANTPKGKEVIEVAYDIAIRRANLINKNNKKGLNKFS